MSVRWVPPLRSSSCWLPLRATSQRLDAAAASQAIPWEIEGSHREERVAGATEQCVQLSAYRLRPVTYLRNTSLIWV